MAAVSCEIAIPFPTAKEADIAYNSIRVDKDPKKGGVTKTLSLKDNSLHAHFEASSARMLRVAVNGFMDLVILVTQTMEQFGPPIQEN